MTQENWIQLAIAMVTPLSTLTIVMVGFIYNNSRMSDLRQDLLARVSELRADVDRRLTGVETKLDLLTGKVVELDSRLTRLEERFAR
ncbi:MAG: hypothetical protein HY822_18255 [Acidobacteria bacterium]|nr:hypothetical protein [Acidobacteriota bacterium]